MRVKLENRMLYQLTNINQQIKTANMCIEKYLNLCSKSYISYSGGKDSSVMLHLISKYTKELPVFTEHDDLDTFGKEKHCKEFVELCGFKNYEYVKASESAFNQLNIDTVIGEKEMSANKLFYKVVDTFLEKYPECDGHFMGIRAQESKGRKINYAIRGEIYQRGNLLVCAPLSQWKGVEVFSYIIQNKLPYMHVYDNDKNKKPHELRLSWYANPLFFGLGNIVNLKNDYPDLFEKICKKVPEIRSFL